MSLKCSLFGHRYGDTEVRRDREQQGSELVETVQEVKICDRCGEQLVISETTEVTTVETADDGERATEAAGGGSDGRGAGRQRGAGATGPPDDRTGRGNAGGSPDPGGTGGSGPSDAGVNTAGTQTADAGASGDTAGSVGDPTGESPEQDMPPARKDDAIIIDEDGEEQPSDEWPQDDDTTEDVADDWEPDTELDTDTDSATGRDPPSESGGGLTVPEGEFHCPECGFSTAVESSSLREGDFCPECHRGALEHHSG
jgi:hypothetical protein